MRSQIIAYLGRGNPTDFRGPVWILQIILFRCITDNNREEMVSLLKETIDILIEESEGDDYYQKVPDINRAKEIECYRRFRHKDITIYYEDGAFYVLHMRNYDGEPLVSLIRDEGYNVYFRSLEFLADLIKPIIALIFVTLAVVVIRKN